MTPEEQAWLVNTSAQPQVRAMLERLAPHSEKAAGLLRLAQASIACERDKELEATPARQPIAPNAALRARAGYRPRTQGRSR